MVEGLPVHQRIRFTTPDAEARGHRFSEEMLKRGVLWHPACANIMRDHTADDIERVVLAAAASLRVIADESEAMP